MSTWDELKVILARLRDLEPNPMLMYPGPEFDQGRHPPISIHFEAWAADIARDLDERFGSDVRLRVGALDYPEGVRSRPPRVEPAEDLSPQEFHVELDGPLSVRSGYTAQHHLLITNLTDTEHTLSSNGSLSADIVDRSTSLKVGGFTGAQTLALHIARIAPGTLFRIRLIVGTASYLPELGYAIPPGEWAAQVVLRLSDGRTGRALRTPPLPITVTD